MTGILFKFIIYPSCERALKNGRVKSEIVRKSSLKFVFCQGHCLISEFAGLKQRRTGPSFLKT